MTVSRKDVIFFFFLNLDQHASESSDEDIATQL